MNGERALSALLAVCCLFALGASASTLDSSVDTTPDDVIDFDVASLPLPSDDVTALKQQIQSGSAGDTQSSQPPPEEGEQGPPQEKFDEPSDEMKDRGGPDDRTGAQEGSSGEQETQGQGPGEPSLLDRLLALLAKLLAWLLSILPALVLVAAVASAIRFRDRLRAAAARLADRFGVGRGSGATAKSDVESLPAPSNPVSSAWFEMVRRAGLSDPTTRTPRQCARAAIEAGADADAARSLTETFEEVRYGGAPVTEPRRTQARRDIEHIRGQLGGGT
jgi:hypothetical protein